MVMEKYTVLNPIGKGSYGEVFLCNHKRQPHKKLVLKKMSARGTSQKELLAATTEINLLKSLNHPNIVKYYDSFEDSDGSMYIVMRYCEGGDMYKRLQTQNGIYFDEKQIVIWFVQIALAMQHLHSQNILHRDLKTQNIFLTDNDIIKLGDFGIARTLDNKEAMASTLIGTPYYMSPEIFANKPYNHKSDIWALGCCLFEMCALKHAFNAGDFYTLMQKINKGRTPSVPQQYSDELRSLVKRMLQHNPDDRPSVDEVLRDPYVHSSIREFLAKNADSSKRMKECPRRRRNEHGSTGNDSTGLSGTPRGEIITPRGGPLNDGEQPILTPRSVPRPNVDVDALGSPRGRRAGPPALRRRRPGSSDNLYADLKQEDAATAEINRMRSARGEGSFIASRYTASRWNGVSPNPRGANESPTHVRRQLAQNSGPEEFDVNANGGLIEDQFAQITPRSRRDRASRGDLNPTSRASRPRHQSYDQDEEVREFEGYYSRSNLADIDSGSNFGLNAEQRAAARMRRRRMKEIAGIQDSSSQVSEPEPLRRRRPVHLSSNNLRGSNSSIGGGSYAYQTDESSDAGPTEFIVRGESRSRRRAVEESAVKVVAGARKDFVNEKDRQTMLKEMMNTLHLRASQETESGHDSGIETQDSSSGREEYGFVGARNPGHRSPDEARETAPSNGLSKRQMGHLRQREDILKSECIRRFGDSRFRKYCQMDPADYSVIRDLTREDVRLLEEYVMTCDALH
eukprot:Clim_evm21s55 gene=Clim_evmTU21s55